MNRVLLASSLVLLLGCSPSSMRQQIEIDGVGLFSLETIEVLEGHHHYLCELARSGDDPLLIVIYPERDRISTAYATLIRAAVEKTVRDPRLLIARAEPQIRELMSQYGLDLPDEFSEFVEVQRLTHVKVGEDRTELIYDTCSFFPNFDLNAILDDDVEIGEVWFDG